jgi:hypothetical protein
MVLRCYATEQFRGRALLQPTSRNGLRELARGVEGLRLSDGGLDLWLFARPGRATARRPTCSTC